MKTWEAQWIWTAGHESDNNVYAEARKTFQLDSLPAKADLRITANQQYKLFINGKEAGRGPSPSNNLWKYFDSYDAASYLQAGVNIIAVTAYNFGTERIVTNQMQGPGGILLQLDLYNADADDADLTIATGPDWKCRRSPRWTANPSRQHYWGGFREIYLASAEDGWEQADYSDAAWPAARVVAGAEQPDSPWPRLIPREIPRLKESLRQPKAVIGSESFLGQIIHAESLLVGASAELRQKGLTVDASVPGSFPQITYDFDREVVGYPELVVDAPEGGVLQLFYGESLEVELTDTFMLKKGTNRLSSFGRRAFRYMKLAVQATMQPIVIQELNLRFVHYPFPEQGSFRSSDELLDRIWETGKYTTLVNTQDHFEDCPHREKALWVADAVVMAKVVYQVFGDAAIVRKCLLQSARNQNEDGSIPGTGPEKNTFVLPDFCAHWLYGVKEYYDYSGDVSFLQEVWPNIVKLSEWFAAQEDAEGLFSRADRNGWWCFIDWSDDIERKDRVTAISCFYYKFLKLAAEISDVLGEKRGAEFNRKAMRLRAAVRDRLRIPGSKLFADCMTDEGLSGSVTAQTNFAAVWSGITDEEEAVEFIRDVYLTGSLPRIRGAFFYHIVLETLFRHGFANEAVEQIRYYWGAMLDRGARTWWETFDPELPFCTIPSPYQGHTPTYLQDAIPVSHSHGWGASPTNLLTSEVLGVDASNLGSGMVTLSPTIVDGVTWAEGVIPTPSGDIQASWRTGDDGKLHYEVLMPAGLKWTGSGLHDVQVEQLGDTVRITGEIIPGSIGAGAPTSIQP
ncbi:glycoside hydrolase family 78 protein [Paenibacillus spongiae]|uniref:Glycoside hydrolase family 78 protein n=1 Tax=Paenibacillus spongiae TaxID=2909671 RepID=A0ABY5S7Q6_9BACL|nr:glycoside hydrolase family 78 protein [Paenibacillus spongiae]UVI29615.1 glycoside hydrolase family 78 protein [Paenibacillus spongiae]